MKKNNEKKEKELTLMSKLFLSCMELKYREINGFEQNDIVQLISNICTNKCGEIGIVVHVFKNSATVWFENDEVARIVRYESIRKVNLEKLYNILEH